MKKALDTRRFFILLLLLCLRPLVAGDSEILSAGRVTLPASGIRKAWDAMDETKRRQTLPFWIESLDADKKATARKELMEILGSSSDPVLMGYRRAGRVILEESDPARRASRLMLERTLDRRHESTAVIDFFVAVSRVQKGDSVPATAFLSLCALPDEARACEFYKIQADAEALLARPRFEEADLRNMLRRLGPYLTRDFAVPAFYRETLMGLGDTLLALGLPMEGAILLDKMTRHDKHPDAKSMRMKVPFLLAGAGDFAGASQYIVEHADVRTPELMALRFEWLTLGGRFRDARALLNQLGADRIAMSLAAYKDPYTGQPYNADELRIRGAMLLHMAGDAKSATRELELLSEQARTQRTKLSARLRMAQIMLAENPDLAHKIAEDVTYQAQEKDFTALEYAATVLDGWAVYYKKDYFIAIVNFTKASGIFNRELGMAAVEYSRILGMFAASARLYPGANHTPLIARLNSMLQTRPFNAALYTFGAYIPPGAGVDFFTREAAINLHARGDRWTALNLFIDRDRTQERYPPANTNPGGLRGYSASVFWSRLSESYPVTKSVIKRDVCAEAQRLGVSPVFSVLQPANFRPGEGTLFSFSMGGERHFYLAHTADRPYWAGAGKYRRLVPNRVVDLYAFMLDPAKVTNAARCRPGGLDACTKGAKDFEGVRERLRSADLVVLNVPYVPDFDPTYESLLPGQQVLSVYFRSPSAYPQGRVLTDSRLLKFSGCSGPDDAEAIPAFQTLGGVPPQAGIWFWPERTDDKVASGRKRPVFLRSFACGESKARLWDMERFSEAGAPAMLVYAKRSDDGDLDRAFARHFGEKGTVLVEAENPKGDAAMALTKAVKDSSKEYPRNIRALLIKERKRLVVLPYRVILPGLN